jgi:hypothetical protein
MRLETRLHHDYLGIRPQCTLVTAGDSRYAPFMFNTLAAMHDRFPSHPDVHVFDLGLDRGQRKELSRVPWIRVREVDPFVPHWKLNWTWKPWVMAQASARYAIYFDSANILLYRPLENWFLAVARRGHFAIANGQRMEDITPSDYWSPFGLDSRALGGAKTFGAGLLGYDLESASGSAVEETLRFAREGWTLGCSGAESSRTYDRSVIRDCPCFRCDQTLLNLAFRKHLGGALQIRRELPITGLGGPSDHPRQYLWYARKNRAGLGHYWKRLDPGAPAFWSNRLKGWLATSPRYQAWRVMRWAKAARRRPPR